MVINALCHHCGRGGFKSGEHWEVARQSAQTVTVVKMLRQGASIFIHARRSPWRQVTRFESRRTSEPAHIALGTIFKLFT